MWCVNRPIYLASRVRNMSTVTQEGHEIATWPAAVPATRQQLHLWLLYVKPSYPIEGSTGKHSFQDTNNYAVLLSKLSFKDYADIFRRLNSQLQIILAPLMYKRKEQSPVFLLITLSFHPRAEEFGHSWFLVSLTQFWLWLLAPSRAQDSPEISWGLAFGSLDWHLPGRWRMLATCRIQTARQVERERNQESNSEGPFNEAAYQKVG